jgi:hypothetical protein
MVHKRSLSSGAVSLSAVDDINEIDAMTAGLLPGLVPGLKVGRHMKIRGSILPTDTFNMASKTKLSPGFGVSGASEAFSSPELHSTPARKEEARSKNKKISEHQTNQYDLPR